MEVLATAATTGSRVDRRDRRAAACVAVPDRNTVAPPELAADGPVADILEPVEVDPGEALRHDADPAVAHDVEGRLRQRRHLHIPLIRDERLDHGVAALAVADGVDVWLLADEEAFALELLDEKAAGLERRQTGVAARVLVHRAVEVHADDRGEAVAPADLEVGRIVAGRDLDRAGPKDRID